MKPIFFPEHNKVFGANQPEYAPLPALLLEDPNGTVISCWRLSFWERIRILFTGRMWVSLWTFKEIDKKTGELVNKPLTPSYLTTIKEELIPITKIDQP